MGVKGPTHQGCSQAGPADEEPEDVEPGGGAGGHTQRGTSEAMGVVPLQEAGN